MDLRELEAYVRSGGTHPYHAIRSFVLPRMRRMVADAVRAAAPQLRKGSAGRRCFQLLSVDFCLDEELRPWLLGFAENPSLDAPTLQAEASIRSMLAEMVRLAVDPLFPGGGHLEGGIPADSDQLVVPTGPTAVLANTRRLQRRAELAGAEQGNVTAVTGSDSTQG